MHQRLAARLARTPQRLAVDGHNPARGQVRKRRNPGDEARFELVRIDRGEDPVERVMRWNAAGQGEKRLQPRPLLTAELGNIVPTFGAAQHGGDRDQQNLVQPMLPVPLHTRIAHLGKILQGILHIPFSLEHHHNAYSKP